MSLETDLSTLNEYLASNGNSCVPPQDIAANYRKNINKHSTKKPIEAKHYFRYVQDEKNEIVLDCTFKINGMHIGFFSIRRCKGTEKWSKDGRYYIHALMGNNSTFDGGAITGLKQAKALAMLNTRILIAALQNVNLK